MINLKNLVLAGSLAASAVMLQAAGASAMPIAGSAPAVAAHEGAGASLEQVRWHRGPWHHGWHRGWHRGPWHRGPWHRPGWGPYRHHGWHRGWHRY